MTRLHFHEEPVGLHASLRNAEGDSDRFRGATAAEQADLLAEAIAGL